MKKALILIGVVLILVVAINYSDNELEPPVKPVFKIAEVTQGAISVNISATGIVEPNFKVEVKSKASGEVLSFPMLEGDKIKKGTLLLQLDKSDEKRNVENHLINGGFFVCEPTIFDLIEGDKTSFEFTTLKELSLNTQLNSCKHSGFWKPMDTLRDKTELNELWESNLAPWKIWQD